MSAQAQPGKDGGSRALLICPDARMSAELSNLLAVELPAARLAALQVYPDRGAAATLASEAHVCFLDAASDAEAAFTILAWFGAEVPELPVVMLLRSNDPEVILSGLRRGAAEFLIQPFTADQFAAVLRKLARFRNGLAITAKPSGRVYCVLPGKGASGATTVACTLAFALKRVTNGRVLLADLDGLTGTIAFMLKLKSQYSFVDVVNRTGSFDDDIWKAIATPSHGLDVLLSPENPFDCYAEAVDPALLVGSARQAYETVILDAGGAYGNWNTSLARLADVLMVVTTNELPALHATQRALGSLEAGGVGRAKPQILVNRYLPKIGLEKQEIAGLLGTEVLRALPSDFEAIRKAVIEGKPVPPASRFGAEVAALARAVSGHKANPAKNAKAGLLDSVRALFHR